MTLGASAGSGCNDFLFLPFQATDNDVGTFGEVNYFFSDDPDRWVPLQPPTVARCHSPGHFLVPRRRAVPLWPGNWVGSQNSWALPLVWPWLWYSVAHIPKTLWGIVSLTPPQKKQILIWGMKKLFFSFTFFFFFFYNLPDIFILQGGHLSQHRKITILTNLFLSFPSVVDKWKQQIFPFALVSKNLRVQLSTHFFLTLQYFVLIFHLILGYSWWASLVVQTGKSLPAVLETQSLGWEDLLEKEMATHSNILAWRIPRTEPGGYSPWGHKESDMTGQLTHSWLIMC